MTLGDIFSGKVIGFNIDFHENNTDFLIKNHFYNLKSLLNNKKDSSRNITLEKQLNELIYGTIPGIETEYSKSINSIADSYIQEILNRISKIDLNSLNSDIEAKVNKEAEDPTSRASLQKVDALITAIETDIETLLFNAKGQSVEKKINELKNKMNSIKERITAINSLDNLKGRKFLSYKDGQSFKDLKGNLILLERYAELVRILPNANIMGDAFENTAKRALNAEAKKRTNEIFDELLGAKKWGSKKVSRTSVTGGIPLKVSVDFSALKKLQQNENSNVQNLRYKDGNMQIIYEASESRSSKMDVEIKFNTGKSTRLSLKNWGNIESTNFLSGMGTTNTLGALLRSTGEINVNNYSLVLLSNRNSLLSSAHEYAKIGIATDILMGISQRYNWAEELVINDRSRKHIYVFNMPLLIQNLSNDLEISGYQENSLHQIAYDVLGTIKLKSGRTSAYIQNMYGVLRSMIVTAKLSNSLINSITSNS